MRIFIAIDCDHKEFFSNLQHKIRHKSNRMTYPKAYHITLKFIGEVNGEQIKEIKQALSGISFQPFDITINSIGVFPNIQDMRVIWAGLKENPQLMKIQEQVNTVIQKYSEDTKDFIPHITLARIKHIEHKKAFKDMIKNIKMKPIKIYIKEFKLIKSTLTNEGSAYEDLAVFSAKTA